MRQRGAAAVRLVILLLILALAGLGYVQLYYPALLRPALPAQVRLYRYTDEKGEPHYVDSLDKVPAEKREQAAREADVPRINTGDYDAYTDAVGEAGPRKRRR